MHVKTGIQSSTVPAEALAVYWDNLSEACGRADIPREAFHRDARRWLGHWARGQLGAEFLPLLPAQRMAAERIRALYPDAAPSDAERLTCVTPRTVFVITLVA